MAVAHPDFLWEMICRFAFGESASQYECLQRLHGGGSNSDEEEGKGTPWGTVGAKRGGVHSTAGGGVSEGQQWLVAFIA